MLTVGIETSGQSGSVALVEQGRVLAEASLSHTGRRHARTLVSELKSLFERIDCSPREAECVAVSIGPGSFTGLRVGVVCAKTFAYATGCRLVAVDTLEVIAAAAPDDVTSVATLVDAMRGDAFHARYSRLPPLLSDAGLPLPLREGSGAGHRLAASSNSAQSNAATVSRWQRQGDIGLTPWKVLIPTIPSDTPLTGPLLASLPVDAINHVTVPAAGWHPTAAAVAWIGERDAVAGRGDDLWRLEPLYIRKSAAEEKPHPGHSNTPTH